MEVKSGRIAHEDGAAARKDYVAPLLKVYGDVASVTRSAGMKGTVSDGGGAPGMSKTS